MTTETIETDVVICGSGSAGVCAAVWLAQAGINFHVLESRSGPLEIGQADGVQCRTVEIYESFGLSEELLHEACHIYELTFWGDDKTSGRIVRTSRAPDTPIGLSHQPHVILNQARMNGLLLGKIAPHRTIDYGHVVTGLEYQDVREGDAFPLTVYATHEGKEKVFKTRYVLACDGAHSSIRRALGYTMEGDTSDAVWGVTDVFAQTDFPDIRRKVTIHTDRGALLIIPREGGEMVRFYLQMPSNTDPKTVTLEQLHARAKSIFQGFQLDIAETLWWSAYTIGQRLASSFSAANNRVLLAGDACHTHSPKAGQGMNVSLQDGYNVGWKLAQVLRKQISPKAMSTYVLERHKVAADLIDFDRRLTRLYHEAKDDPEAAERFKDEFLKSAKYMAGLTARYEDSILTNAADSDQDAAKHIVVGMRHPSAKVVRYCDVRPLELQRALPSDNRWRIVVFIGDLQNPECARNLQKVSLFNTRLHKIFWLTLPFTRSPIF